MRVLPRLLRAAGAIALAFVASQASADLTKDQCIDANARAQSLRRAGKLAAARAELQTCDVQACPAIVRDDCTRRMDELDKVQPTILFEAKDGAGRDLVDVKVTVDGQPLVSTLTGTAERVDPGAHSFTFTTPGQPPLTQTFVVREGEKARRERIVIGPPAVATRPESRIEPAPEPASPGLGAQRIAGIGVAGAGVVGIGIGAVFGLLASSAWSSAKTACGGDTGHCADLASATSYRSTTTTDGTVSTIGFIAGGALLAGGAALFFTGKPRESATTGSKGGAGGPAASIVVSPAFGPGHGGIAVQATF